MTSTPSNVNGSVFKNHSKLYNYEIIAQLTFTGNQTALCLLPIELPRNRRAAIKSFFDCPLFQLETAQDVNIQLHKPIRTHSSKTATDLK